MQGVMGFNATFNGRNAPMKWKSIPHFQNTMEKMVERCKIDISNTTIHDCLLSWLVMGRMDLLSQQIYNAIIQYNAIKYMYGWKETNN
jgi:hypothetical protein